MTFCPCPKGRPAALEREDRRKARESRDRAENATVKRRSEGQCEVWQWERTRLGVIAFRCEKRALHIHHLLGGIGVRAIGKSALAENKLHVCMDCHRAIHAHVLVRDGQYWRRIQ